MPIKQSFVLLTWRLHEQNVFHMLLLNQLVLPAASTRNLGVIFDDNKMSENTFLICRTCYYNIHDLRRARRYLPLSIAKYIVTALVISRLYYLVSFFMFLLNISNI